MSAENDKIVIRKTEGEVRMVCDVCSHDRTKKNEKCLAINSYTGTYLCHHCGDSGILDTHKTMKKEKVFYEIPKPINNTSLSQNTVDWFKSRGISQGVINRNKITQGVEYMPQVD